MDAMRNVKRFAVAATLSVLAGGLMMGAAAPTAHAEQVPFWVQRDIDDGKRARRSAGKVKVAKAAKTQKYASRKKLGGYAEATEPKRSRRKGVRVASIDHNYVPNAVAPKSVTGGGGVRWTASASCLNGSLRAIIAHVGANYAPVTVNSTCRSHSHNRRVGGAPRSQHLTGNAVDFRVRGNVRAVYAYLKANGAVGGLKHYGGGLFHIDTGARRTW